MEDSSLSVLLWAAVSVAALHTLIGVDHTLPFVVLGRARGWTLRRTLLITALCGLGHVGSSMVLGMVGVGLGLAAERLSWIEGQRGTVAAWALIALGLTYAAWGLWRGHSHAGLEGEGARFEHGHGGHTGGDRALTAWALFVIFVLGPCEPLIPLMMAPALMHDPWSVAMVVGVFSAVTVGTMLLTVALLHLGMRAPVFTRLERHTHVLAGLAIAGSGLAIELLGV